MFIKGILAMHRHGESYNKYKVINPRCDVEGYRSNSEKIVPLAFFTFTHIKNTAVHANTDRYRDSDLVNGNSHNSSTEKKCYLTDDNKDYVNRHGRLTRMILNDMALSIFRPSIEKAELNVRRLELRTRFVVVK